MARLARLVVAGQAHCIVQRGLAGHDVFADDADRAAYLAALHDAAAAAGVALHAYSLLAAEVMLLATPAVADALSRMAQAVGRRYVSAYNRRHGRSGTLWDGRFRCAVVEPGRWRLLALRWIDGQGGGDGATLTSAGHRTGAARLAGVVDPPEYWQLGNTPFEREAAWRALLAQPLADGDVAQLQRMSRGGWVLGSTAFAAGIARVTERPTTPRPRGRPRSAVA